MVKGLVALGLVGALASGPVLAAPPASAKPAAPASPPASAAAQPADPALAFYPTAARAAGVEGQAVIRCTRNEHLALKGCALVSETPAGQGFGAAALAMAAQSPDNPKLTDPDTAAKPAQDISVHFIPRPLAIDPDISGMAHMRVDPKIVTQPTPAQIQAAYPERALSNQIEGVAAIECAVTADGRLAHCQLSTEAPGGYGFGQATLELAGDWLLKPRMIDGEAVVTAKVRVGIHFVPGDPTAPLSLGVKPAQ